MTTLWIALRDWKRLRELSMTPEHWRVRGGRQLDQTGNEEVLIEIEQDVVERLQVLHPDPATALTILLDNHDQHQGTGGPA